MVALALQDVESGQGEDGTSHHTARASTDALDDDVLRKCVVFAGQSRQSDGDNGDWDGGFKHLPDLQAEVGGGSRKQDGHQQADADRPYRNFLVLLVFREYGLVLFARLQFALRVLGQFELVVFHI